MSLNRKMMRAGAKPSGFFGRRAGKRMNKAHARAYALGLRTVPIEPGWTILDVGCGGGRALALLAEAASQGKVHGLDHAPDMVNLARAVNRKAVEAGRVEVHHGGVSRIPLEDRAVNLVTAFETIQFWPSLASDLREVLRVLRPGGVFLVVNRYPSPAREANPKTSLGLQLPSAEAYKEALHSAGFGDVGLDEFSLKEWILVTARKPA